MNQACATICVLLVLYVYGTNTRTVSVTTSLGTIYGYSTSTSHEYLGIPFAEAERWKPPQDITKPFPNNGFYATSFGSCCPQPDLDLYIPTQSEECLSLNIFTPSTKSSKLPVMVWFHGGGGISGCSAQSNPTLYNGTGIVSQAPVIIVTVNYRLGILGTLYLPELAQEDSSWPTAGNYFILDQQSALRWVQRHIADFGGNPANVTVFGESAGANNVVELSSATGSQGLFSSIIPESGTFLIWAGYSNTSVASQFGYTYSEAVGCTQKGSDLLQCLRNVPTDTLLQTSATISTPALTVVEGHLFEAYPMKLIEQGKFLPVNILVGNNLPDNFPACAELPRMTSEVAIRLLSKQLVPWGCPPDRVDDVIAMYQVSLCKPEGTHKCCQVVTDVFLDQTMRCNARRMMNGMQNSGYSNKFYWYQFDCQPTCPESNMGVCAHTAEIEYVFGVNSNYVSKEPPTCEWDTTTTLFSKKVVHAWTNFAMQQSPFPDWQQFENSNFFKITPFEHFHMVTSNTSFYCDNLWDPIDAEMVDQMFP